MLAPAIVDAALFAAAQEQLRENRTRARVAVVGQVTFFKG